MVSDLYIFAEADQVTEIEKKRNKELTWRRWPGWGAWI
jgi:hypothetical protein